MAANDRRGTVSRISMILLATALVCGGLCSSGIGAEAGKQPNILVILTDDMGWSDLGCYGGEMRTPNLDGLASSGLRFTQFYNTARCCPTRASLLTGLYPHQAGIGHMMNDRGLDGYRGDLNNHCATIAEVLRPAGYRTYAVGKWHVTRFDGKDGPKDNWPLQRGFDKYYGLIWGASSQYDPAVCRGNTYYTCENDPEYHPEKFYFTNALSDNAVTFLQQHEKETPDKPFFMYLAYTAAHWPMQALEEDIARHKGQYDAGYDAVRKARLERLKKMGLIDPKWEPAPTAAKWDSVEHREWEKRCMEVYAAMIDCMDQGVGRVVAELKRQGKLDDTVILFMQDNGACAEEIGRAPSKPTAPADMHPLAKDELPASGHQKQTRDGRPMRSGPEAMPGGPDTYIAYGLGWANVSNTPFREYKHWVHEGGISTPLIAHWPKGIDPSRNNTLVKEPAHLIDIMATCVDLAGAEYPTERQGTTVTAMQGTSLRPLLQGKPFNRARPIFWEHEGNRAVRQGQWKLVAKENQPWELYDMLADRPEMKNLADKKPELVKELSSKWDEWAKESNVTPLGAWRGLDKETSAPRGSAGPFRFKQGDELAVDESPSIADRGLTVTAEIAQLAPQGVILAQGGPNHGYVLYMKNNRLCFATRVNGKLTEAICADELSSTPLSVTAVFERSGAMRLEAGGKTVAIATAPGAVFKNPGEGLSVGFDSGKPIGEYKTPNTFGGKISSVTLKLQSQ